MNALTKAGRFETMRVTNAAFHLENEGCCLLPRLVSPAMIARIATDLDADFEETPLCSGPFYGERTKRFGRLLARSSSVASLVMNDVILALADRILGPYCDNIQLNVAQAIEIQPEALAQYPHRDQDMWWGDKGRIEYLVNVIWPLTPFTAANGATCLWPDSHGATALGDGIDRTPITADCDPGDAIVFLGSTLHAAGANITSAPRRGIVIGYSLGWLKPYENPWLAYPPEVARHFSPELAALVGYQQHRPNLGNFEGQCPSVLLHGRGAERLPAMDALHPDQAAQLADYVARQRIDLASTRPAQPA
jgi:ectoine hydroxylase-related dioxygenase (phytanoyl-CoA dioxygenase family)